MTHTEIENQEIVERYVRSELDVQQRLAFQEHFFACDECFANVQMMEQFVAGVRHVAETGLLSTEDGKPLSFPNWVNWLKPSFAITALATVVLMAVVAWLVFVRLPSLRAEIARERTAREQIEQSKQREIDELTARLTHQPLPVGQDKQLPIPNENAQSKEETTKVSPPGKRASEGDTSEMLAQNSPIVVLQSTRGSQDTNELILSQNTSRFVCWIEVGPQIRFESFRVDVFNTSSVAVSSVDRMRKNTKNVVVVSLPTEKFPTGDYLVKLYGVAQNQTSLIAEYKLHVQNTY